MIYKIEFSASLPPTSIRKKLLVSFKTCKSIKGAVAYWTIGTDFFQNIFTEALLKHSSFMCVDLKLPTNIDKLASFARKGSNIFLHHYMLDTKIKYEAKDNLLHEKIFLFEFGNNAELWVGSHNMTIRALLGINKEASLIITLSKDDELFRKVNEYLKSLRDICIPFDIKQIEYYKWLQGKFENSVLFLKMFTHNLSELRQPNATVQLIGLDNFGFGPLKTINKDVFLIVDDGYNSTVFRSEILLVGEVDKTNAASYDIDFHPMMHAFIQKGIGPFIMPVNKYNITGNEIKKYHYYVNIQIKKELPKLNYIEVPKDLWEIEKFELNNELEGFDYFLMHKLPDRIKIKKASIKKVKSFSIEKPQEIINPSTIKKLQRYYDEVVTKDIKMDVSPSLFDVSIPIPKEIKKKNTDIIFQGIIKE